MENILYNISQVLGITIIHSLWQGLLIYFLLRVVLLVAGKLPSSTKYMLAMGSLMVITGWFAYTLVHQIQVYDWLAKPANLANMPIILELPANIRQFNEQTIRYYYSIEEYLPYVTALYVAGLFLNLVRIVLAHKKIRSIKRTMSIGVQLQQQIGSLAKKLDIGKKVKVGFSKMVDVPCIVGYIKPVILLPLTLSTYLGAEEIEAILLHELAHIKRNDYVLNLLQQVITTLLFFNPCVLLINKIIGEERENSCDDMVVNATQNPVIYAKALFKLEQNRQNELQLALAVTGKKYHLLNRIERIMKTKKQTPSVRPTLVAMLILTISIGSLAILNPRIAEGKISLKAINPAITKLLATDTVPAKKAVKAQAKAVKATAKANVKASAALKAKFKTEKDAKSFNYGYRYNYNGLNDPELERLSKEVEKHADAVGRYYDSPEFKAQSDQMSKLGDEVSAFYDSDKIKQATAAQEKAAAEFDKLYAGKEVGTEQMSKQMEVLGKQMEQYFNSPEFKTMNDKLMKQYGISQRDYHTDKDENYKKYQAELDKTLSPEIKQATKQMRDLGQQMRARFDNPDVRKAREQMRAAGADMREAFNNPDIKLKQEEMRRLGEKMRGYTGNASVKQEQKLLREASEKLRAYTQTPEFKKKLAEYRKAHPEEMSYWKSEDNDNDNNNKQQQYR
ncbi:M48 family metalloprotease [Mucilaginibacter sp. 14171R-50]|uniref:M56 family metallopeptidase n=1 Tax=Mucilaginibacter sp. 14171R-50 TaxID=2703789 RepID=UPI00138D786D|nr:M56 family metallopeptidase [Mucilaginibacter sp. 14171R-50]QHS55661.1 M48 family metalloprotease [Mucilaginibacter sp. 14171R-50]